MKTISIQFIMLLLMYFWSLPISGQYDWGKVTEEELSMTHYALDSLADAVVLFYIGSANLDYRIDRVQIKYKYHKRIKIFREGGYKFADIEIPYFDSNNQESVRNLKAQVISPDGSVYELDKDEIFEEDLDEDWKMKKFSFPKIEPGAIIEYRYEIESKRYLTLRSWNFQDEIPVKYAEFELDVPEAIEYIELTTNVHLVEKSGDRFIARDIPGMKEESYITNMNDYRGSIQFQLRGTTNSYDVFTPFMSDWHTLTKELVDHSGFGGQYLSGDNISSLLSDAAEIDLEEYSTDETIERLAQVIHDRVKWNGEYGVFPSKGIKDLIEEGNANGSGLNLMLLSLLRAYNIDAFPLLSSTRSHGKMFPIYPFLSQFNHCLVYARIDNQDRVFDLSSPFKPASLLDVNSLNHVGLVVLEGNPFWIELAPPKSTETYYVELSLDENSRLTGTLQGRYSHHSAIDERKAYAENKSESLWLERLQARFPDAEIVSIQAHNPDNILEHFKDEIKFVLPSAVTQAGDFLYIDINVYSAFEENPFQLPERTYPVDFSYPFKEQLVIKLQIPEGYTVESMPERSVLTNETNSVVFAMTPVQSTEFIQFNRFCDIKQQQYMPGDYQGLKLFVSAMIEKMNEPVVLKKAE